MSSSDHSGGENKAATSSIRERRKFPRRSCRLETQITMTDCSLRVSGTLTDISLGGCYVEMLSPLPINTDVELDFIVDNSNFHMGGQVRNSRSGLGMGIAFRDVSVEIRERLRRFTDPARSDSETGKVTAPHAATKSEPHALTISNALEAVVRVLLRKGIVTKEELAEEFEKLKGQ